MTSAPKTLSTIKSAPVSYFVYSALSCFGARHGGALPGMWFMRAIGEAGRDPAAIRQTLYRMEQEGELVARKVGRAKLYSATRFANAEIDAGTEKIFEPRGGDWDGQWTIVNLAFATAAHRVDRERVVALLAVEGFAHLGGDSYAHPRADGARLHAALPKRARPFVSVIRGHQINPEANAALSTRWNPAQLGARYRSVFSRLHELQRAIDRKTPTDREAFLYRFAVVFDYLGVAWDDPGLPSALLPAEWPGEPARVLASGLYTQLLPAATRYADRLLADVSASLVTT